MGNVFHNKKRRPCYVSTVGGVPHDRGPAFEGGHLEQGQIGHAHVVEVHRRVLPRVVREALAVLLVLDDFERHDDAVRIDALTNHQRRLERPVNNAKN